MAKSATTKCSVFCNFPATYAKVCPGSTRFETLREALGQDMLDGTYRLDSKGCYVLTKQEVKFTGSKSKMESLFARLVKALTRRYVKKEGF